MVVFVYVCVFCIVAFIWDNVKSWVIYEDMFGGWRCMLIWWFCVMSLRCFFVVVVVNVFRMFVYDGWFSCFEVFFDLRELNGFNRFYSKSKLFMFLLCGVRLWKLMKFLFFMFIMIIVLIFIFFCIMFMGMLFR